MLTILREDTEYVYFNRDDGFGLGEGPQKLKNHHRGSPYLNLGSVSLTVDTSMEYGVFQRK